ncbi:DUF4290 domain-containing protein [Bacteroidales bacterium OttesenSCG-928-K22]|nr:DUF4290 domain-containing protein [Bacteroidales bacterium OttesenSCG-928-K22]
MEYNTEREKLFLPEHGRNIQKMIDFITNIDDKDKRTRYTYGLVNVLYNLNDGDNKDGNYLHKLWDQIHIMSDYKLDVDSPFPVPTPEKIYAKPNRIPYGNNSIRYRHYGNLTQLLINKIVSLPDGEKKEKAIAMIATQMKKLYLIWNRESVDDDLIFKNMNELTRDEININPRLKLMPTSLILSQEKNRILKNAELEPAKNKRKNNGNGNGNGTNSKKKKSVPAKKGSKTRN